MRRGLMAWDRHEVPEAIFDQRLSRLRSELQREGVDAFVAYTNIGRGAAVWWLTGFTPYWNEGLLYAPVQGDMIFATALSKRVAEWIGSVMPAGLVTTTPRPSTFVGDLLAHDGAMRIGILELDDFPAGHAAAILACVPGAELVDVTAAFTRVRSQIDAVERGLLRKADALAAAALAAVDAATTDARAFIAPAETAARLGGAEECFLTAAPDLAESGVFHRTDALQNLGGSFAARISLAYKGAWSRRIVSFSRSREGDAAFAEAASAIETLPRIGNEPGPLLQRHFSEIGRLVDWTIEQPRGSYSLAPVADAAGRAQGFCADAPFVLSVELDIKGRRWLGARMPGLD